MVTFTFTVHDPVSLHLCSLWFLSWTEMRTVMFQQILCISGFLIWTFHINISFYTQPSKYASNTCLLQLQHVSVSYWLSSWKTV